MTESEYQTYKQLWEGDNENKKLCLQFLITDEELKNCVVFYKSRLSCLGKIVRTETTYYYPVVKCAEILNTIDLDYTGVYSLMSELEGIEIFFSYNNKEELINNCWSY